MATSLLKNSLSPGVTTLPQDYSESNFYTAGTDKRGHREEVRVYFPPEVHGLMHAIVQSPSTPYKTLGDLPRDAVAHRVHWLEQNSDDPDLKTACQLYLSLEDNRRTKQRIAAERELLDETREALRDPARSYYLTTEELDLRVQAIETPSLRDEMQRLVATFT